MDALCADNVDVPVGCTGVDMSEDCVAADGATTDSTLHVCFLLTYFCLE